MNFRNLKPKTRRGAVVVRNGYYTFSKEYPAGKLERTSRAVRHRHRKRTARQTVLLLLLFAVLFCASFFAVDFGLKLSKKQPDAAAAAVTQSSTLQEDGVQAMVIPTEALQSKKTLRAAIKRLRRADCNAAVIDFKARNGKLLYSSNEQLALRGKCSVFDNATVRDILKQFASANIHVIARVYCFEDPLIAALDESLAVKYLDTDVLWLDGHEQDGGKPWLNPYSAAVRKYLKSIVREVQAFGVSGVLLSSVCFPTGEAPDTAGFPGENGKKALPHNQLLKQFIAGVKKLLPDTCCLLVETETEAILHGDDVRYDGALLPNAADGIVANAGERPPELVPDKKTKFNAMLTYFSSVKAKTDSEKMFILLLDEAEITGRYRRTLKKNGFADLIRWDTAGTD